MRAFAGFELTPNGTGSCKTIYWINDDSAPGVSNATLRVLSTGWVTQDLKMMFGEGTSEARLKVRLETIRRFFRVLTTVDAAVAVGSTFIQTVEILPSERIYVAGAVQRRQTEFALGRTLARDALLNIGYPAGEIPAGAGREPIWPDRVVGSISHCEDICVAVVAPPKSGIEMLGVDLERIGPMSDLLEVITTARERQQPWFSKPLDPDILLGLCFSAKESAYKALYPRLRRFLDFHDVELHLDFSTCCLRVRLSPQAVQEDPVAARYSLSGGFSVGDGFVMTYAVG